MAKKRKRKSTPKTRKSKSQKSLHSQSKKRSGPLLLQAVQHLRQKRVDKALKIASDALKFASTEAERLQARQVIAEGHFRLAMLGDVSKQRSKLKQALSFTPDDARIRFYHAIALWREDNLSEALKELQFVARREPSRPGLHFLLQLANLASEKSWTPSKLSPSETQTLQTIDKILSQRRLNRSQPSLPSANTDIWKPLIEMYTGHESPVDALQDVAAKSQNANIKSILHYYEGVAAMRKSQGERAQAAWSEAQKTGVGTPWLNENLAYRLREKAAELSKEKKWSEIVTLTTLTPDQLQDRILSETIGLAHFHLGYEQAQDKNWSRAAHYWRKSEQWSRNRYIAQNLALAEEALQNWSNAAEAWRDMVRRRPRSKKSKDYLTDSQVSSIWEHLAECYRNTDDFDEVTTSLKNAVKYDEENLELRMDLARVHYAHDREVAARNQFEAILEIDPNHIDALIPLAYIELERDGETSIPLWKRVLAIQPKHSDAREGLARAYLKKLRETMWLGKSALNRIAKEALADLPDHPLLLFGIGEKYQYLRDNKRSLEFYLRAYEAGPENVRTVDMILQSLLEIGAEKELEALIPKVVNIPSLLPAFWFDLARKALRNDEDTKWIKIYLEEAIALGNRNYVQDSTNTLFMKAYELIERVAPDSLCAYFAQRIRKEVPNDGAVEFVKACEALDDGDERNAKRWFKKAKRAARSAKDNTAVEFIEETEETNFSMPDLDLRSGFLAHLLDMLPPGVDLDDLFD